MGVSPRDLLRDARHLAQRKDFEEARRSAISRGFYAAFHGARIFHAGLPFPGRSKAGVGEHENLIHQLRNPDSRLDAGLQKQSIVIGGLLLRLRPLRVTADYQRRRYRRRLERCARVRCSDPESDRSQDGTGFRFGAGQCAVVVTLDEYVRPPIRVMRRIGLAKETFGGHRDAFTLVAR
jgi:hypothetical protein